ncbi:metallophosphoesterase [Ectobacillus ponti]|uniref:Metallophosphoesterase n=1 Tax=Ectobacillus ponti TaxID=2961894 RepID=A0AA41XB18_9BACI|nr:metallophosphoesterase [Ectobacillus ponti]MCP8969660.1 metallophosphoesterase [Ectobacillus ponti]
MVIRFLLMLLIFAALNVYIGWHGSFLLSFFEVPVPAAMYWIVFWIVSLSYVFGRFKIVPGVLGRAFQWVGSYYFALLEFALILLPVADLIAWGLHSAGVPTTTYVPVLGTFVILVLALLLGIGSWNAWNPIIRTYELHIDKPGGDFKELRVAMASDLHLGNIVENRHLGRLVKAMNAMKPDLILLPGDVIDDVIEPFIRKEMAQVMKGLQSRYGIYAVLGNHEYYGGHIPEYIRQMNSIGIRVLQDETVLVADSFYVAGRKDKTAESMDKAGRLPVADLLADLDKSKPVLLMDHQPYHFDKAAAAGADVLMCGHTHRGQFAPNHLITKRLFELDWGYMLKEKMHVVVSSGFGTWGPPVRIASRSEIIQLMIRFA